MSNAPEEKWLAHNGGLPTGNYPKADLVRYIRADIHDAARAAARAEGLREGMERAAKACDRRAGNASDFDRYTRRAAGMCAADIRAAAEAQP